MAAGSATRISATKRRSFAGRNALCSPSLRPRKHGFSNMEEPGQTLHLAQRWESNMPYVHSQVDGLQHHKKVGTTQCVALVQEFTSAGATASWRQGLGVLGNKAMLKGTAIATFVRGRYPNLAHGNHAALFLRHGPNGFWMMDQWAGVKKLTVSSRFIKSLGKSPGGAYNDSSNNADAFFIIEPK